MDERLERKIAEAREAQAQQYAVIKEIEETALELGEWLKYPVDAYGNVLDMNHLPDVSVALVHHLTRGGWRRHPEKALIKQRAVRGPGYYEDLVTYVGVNESDEPIIIPQSDEPAPDPEMWSVKPTVNMIDEERPQ